MTAHAFGACSSPGIAAYALRRVVAGCSTKIKDIIANNFHVDDCLRSGMDINCMINEAQDHLNVVQRAGLN